MYNSCEHHCNPICSQVLKGTMWTSPGRAWLVIANYDREGRKSTHKHRSIKKLFDHLHQPFSCSEIGLGQACVVWWQTVITQLSFSHREILTCSRGSPETEFCRTTYSTHTEVACSLSPSHLQLLTPHNLNLNLEPAYFFCLIQEIFSGDIWYKLPLSNFNSSMDRDRNDLVQHTWV